MKELIFAIWMLIPFQHSLCYKFDTDFRKLYALETKLMKDQKIKSIKKIITKEGTEETSDFLSLIRIGIDGQPLSDSSYSNYQAGKDITSMKFSYSEGRLDEVRVADSEDMVLYTKNYTSNEKSESECTSISMTAEPRRYKYNYDKKGRIMSIEGYTFFPAGDSTDETREWTKIDLTEYLYDDNNNLISHSYKFSDNEPSITKFEYTKSGFLSSVKWFFTSKEAEMFSTYQYDKRGLITKEKLTSPDGNFIVTYSYEFY